MDDTRAGTDHRLLQGLNRAQSEAVTSRAAPLRILAGAGSGKTRVLTRRIGHRVVAEGIEPGHVLAVTFTRKAANELRHRLSAAGLRSPVTTGTFHAIAAAQLRQRWEERRIEPPQLLDRKVGFVARLMSSRSSTAPLDVVGEIEWAKARLVSAADYAVAAEAANRRPSVDAQTVADTYARYEQEKLARRLVDFDDLLRLATRDLRADPDFAAARRWRFRHLFVDEFQDVNPLQFGLLKEWLGDRLDLCVVGDPNQAIYAWNGADAQYLLEFDRHFPSAETVLLDENYRSTPQILGVANAILSTGTSHHFELRPTQPDGPPPSVRRVADETSEANLIARRLRDAHGPGHTWAEQAVLTRTNAQLPAIEEALTRAGIPYRSRSGTRLLDQPEVRDALKQLRSARNPLLSVALDDLELSLNIPDDAVDPAAPGSSTVEPGLGDERTANIAELVRLGREYLALDPGGSYPGFSTWLSTTLRTDDGIGRDAVELTTFHAAKGLEFDVVHLAGLEEGFVPISHARTNEALDEERRLLYVALTRARKAVHLTYVERRTFGSRSLNRRPSPHLETVELALSMLAGGGAPDDMGSAIAAQRAAMREQAGEPAARRRSGPSRGSTAATVGPADAALFDALKSWRLAQARAAAVPAFVIFNDATLAEVARLKPSNRRQLLAVSGVGPVKAERFGDALLEVVRASVGLPGR